MNKYSMSYTQINDQAPNAKRENRLGFALAVVAFTLYCLASNMAYNDCINLGVC